MAIPPNLEVRPTDLCVCGDILWFHKSNGCQAMLGDKLCRCESFEIDNLSYILARGHVKKEDKV